MLVSVTGRAVGLGSWCGFSRRFNWASKRIIYLSGCGWVVVVCVDFGVGVCDR